MAKRKRVEKIGNVIGSTRPIWGIVLLVIGVYLAMSVLGYHSGQDVLFKEYFEPLLPTTEVTGVNICGKLGATVALSAILVVGAAAYMLPVYVIWYHSRRPCPVGDGRGIAVSFRRQRAHPERGFPQQLGRQVRFRSFRLPKAVFGQRRFSDDIRGHLLRFPGNRVCG